MASEDNIGQAIALQTRATPYHGSPITTGLRLNMSNDLRKAQIEAKKQAAEQKRMQQLDKWTKLTQPKVHPIYSKRVQDIARKGVYFLNDPNESPINKADREATDISEMNYYAGLGDQISSFQNYARNKANVTFPFINKMVNVKDADELTRQISSLSDTEKALSSGAFGFDFSDPDNPMPFVEQPVQKVNVTKEADAQLAKRLGLSDYDVLNKTGNFREVIQKLSPEDVKNLSYSAVLTNPGLGYTLRADNWEEAKKLYEQQPANLTVQEKLDNVDFALAEKSFKNRYVDKHGLRYDRDQNASGGYEVNGKQFNPSLADPLEYVDAYVKAGVLTQQDAAYLQNAFATNPDVAQGEFKKLPTLPAIDPPNTGTFTIVDESGKEIKADNLKAVYVPKNAEGKGGQWFMAGSETRNGIQRPVLIPINERTYGNVISVYGKMSTTDLEKLLNKRMQGAGIKNDVFKLNVLKPQSRGQGDKPQPGKALSIQTIRSKVGTKGFEGYTEKELVDYYKSQGYTIK